VLTRKGIGELVKNARKLKGEVLGINYTGKMLADELKISRSFLGDIETGRTKAPDYLLKSIIDICNLESDYFKDKKVKSENSTFKYPEIFTNANEARSYIKEHKIFSSDGFNIDEESDDRVLEFANALMDQMKLVAYKYKNGR